MKKNNPTKNRFRGSFKFIGIWPKKEVSKNRKEIYTKYNNK